MNWYVTSTQNYPLLSSAIQFAILGTLGEVISASIGSKRLALPCTVKQIFLKMLAWALLGVIIKYGFAGMKGFVKELISHGMLPSVCASGFAWAASVSIFTNLLFGPQMMFFHRLEDNLILNLKGFEGITKAWWTLIWFWTPAHTVTFMLPKHFQIGLAALWSLVLGIILGLSKQKKWQ